MVNMVKQVIKHQAKQPINRRFHGAKQRKKPTNVTGCWYNDDSISAVFLGGEPVPNAKFCARDRSGIIPPGV
ncbi:MAG: hypothetical protein LBB47_01775 [Spirochaetaceae bacterium]|jgi:hypothetical protein|nr:hypothetical protein [Spirochaetaceae bacterium]